MSISITNNNFGNDDMWEYLSTLESIIRQSEEDLVRLEEQEPKDIGNFLFTSTKEGRDSCNDWIALHEGFFTAACRRWAKSLAPAGYDLDDLRQEARIIVFKAWRHYKTDRVDVLPTTFFWKCVENRLKELYRHSYADKRAGERVTFSLPQVESYISFSTEDEDEDMYSMFSSFDPYTDDEYDVTADEAARSYLKSIASMESVEEVIMGRDYEEDVQEAASYLNELERECLLLHLDGYTQNEIGEKVGRSQACISYHLNEAKKQVREHLKSKKEEQM